MTWKVYTTRIDLHLFYSRVRREGLGSMVFDVQKLGIKPYKMFSSNCSECFMKYVLIGDKKNVEHNLRPDRVDVTYLH